jgi:two-component sensor histidine kinase
MTAAVPPMPSATAPERRVALLLPTDADGVVASQVLSRAGIVAAAPSTSVEQLCHVAEAGAAALLLAEEALAGPGIGCLTGFLERQPAWSDIPLIVLTGRGRGETAHWRLVAGIPSGRNATLLERPMRVETLLQAVRVALRARERQYELRRHMAERESLLGQRDVLLREVHHRVKNNLQMIQSLVHMSLARAPSQARPLLTDLISRISAIGQLHGRIYASDSLTEIDAAAYLAGLVDQVAAIYGGMQQRVRIVRPLGPVAVDVDTAIPLGLIATELVPNAFKHAFPAGSKGLISIDLTLRAGTVELAVADDGVGPGRDDRRSASIGLRLVQALTEKIGGRFLTEQGPGLRSILLFPLKERAPPAAEQPTLGTSQQREGMA